VSGEQLPPPAHQAFPEQTEPLKDEVEGGGTAREEGEEGEEGQGDEGGEEEHLRDFMWSFSSLSGHDASF
jgi:hypothetical protein